MSRRKALFSVALLSAVIAITACGMGSDRGTGRSGQSAARSQAGTGQSSPQIAQAQQALKAKGYDPGATDGVMGIQTQQALRNFQQANGLPATGTLDAQTAKALGISTSGAGARSGASSGASSGAAQGSGGSSRTREGGE
jgi:peptidoglycan hydrolase-like protein with peptidoglycan-binding domain